MNDPIKHVVVLMLENNSFDRMLGDFQAIYPNLDGIPHNGPQRTNTDSAGQVYSQAPTNARIVFPDPRHENDHVLNQIEVPPPKWWELSDERRWITVLRIIIAFIQAILSWRETLRKKPKVMAARAPFEG